MTMTPSTPTPFLRVTWRCPNCPAAYGFMPVEAPCAVTCVDCGTAVGTVRGVWCTPNGALECEDQAAEALCDGCASRYGVCDPGLHSNVCDGCAQCHSDPCVCVRCSRCNYECTAVHVQIDGDPYCATCAPIALRDSLDAQRHVEGCHHG